MYCAVFYFQIGIVYISGRTNKSKKGKYQSINSKEDKPTMLLTSSETSSDSEISDNGETADESGEAYHNNQTPR